MLWAKVVQWASPFAVCVQTINLGFTVPRKIQIKTFQHLEKLQQWQNCTYHWQPKHSLVRMAGFGVWINLKVYLDDQLFSLVEVVAIVNLGYKFKKVWTFFSPCVNYKQNSCSLLPDLDNDTASSSYKWNWKRIHEDNYTTAEVSTHCLSCRTF